MVSRRRDLMGRPNVALTSLEVGLRMVADAVAQLRESDEWVDQKASPLGRRAHLEAVRRGELAGHKVSGKVLVRRADLDAYIAKHRVKSRTVEEQRAEEREIAELLQTITVPSPRRRAK
jgi:hypothetical protein